MRVLIVDDEKLALDRLRAHFSDIEGVAIVGEARDGDQALEAIEALKPDLVILDVQMPGRTGLGTATAMKEPRPELVFVTAHEHYAAEAFDVDAADYLLKPVRFDRLRQAVERAKRRRALRDQAAHLNEPERPETDRAAPGSDGFWVPDRDGQRRVPLDTIDWVEAAGDYVMLHTNLRSYMLRATMAVMEDKLGGSGLLRVHRSAFVRPSRVQELRRVKRAFVLVMTDGAQVQVSANYIDSVKQALNID
jgi:two-component system LytT family response regulator